MITASFIPQPQANITTFTVSTSKTYSSHLARIDYPIFQDSAKAPAIRHKYVGDMANTLISLPPEIVHNILKYVNPIDLARLSSTCRMLHRSISQDRLLYKEVYCQHLVSPPYITSFAATQCYIIELD